MVGQEYLSHDDEKGDGSVCSGVCARLNAAAPGGQWQWEAGSGVVPGDSVRQNPTVVTSSWIEPMMSGRRWPGSGCGTRWRGGGDVRVKADAVILLLQGVSIGWSGG